ncbi:MAG: ZIP family metal transporter, partial [Deltaproteobacteria bacterium]
MSPFLAGVTGSLFAGLATGIGGLPVFFVRKVSHRLLDTLLGFAAGVMLAATSFSLVVPAIELGGLIVTAAGMLSGALFLAVSDRIVPHFHDATGFEGMSTSL